MFRLLMEYVGGKRELDEEFMRKAERLLKRITEEAPQLKPN